MPRPLIQQRTKKTQPVKECTLLSFFFPPNCEITTDCYVIKLVYVNMTQEISVYPTERLRLPALLSLRPDCVRERAGGVEGTFTTHTGKSSACSHSVSSFGFDAPGVDLNKGHTPVTLLSSRLPSSLILNSVINTNSNFHSEKCLHLLQHTNSTLVCVCEYTNIFITSFQSTGGVSYSLYF